MGDRTRMRRAVGVAAAVVVVAVLAWQGWLAYERRASADRLEASGSIEATQVDVAPKIQGRVIRLLVAEGDRVRAGQVLVRLDDREARAQVAQAQAAVALGEAKVIQAEQALATEQGVADAQVAQSQAQLTAAEARVPQAETTVSLQRRTADEAVASARAQLGAAQAMAASAHSALAKARNDLARVRALFAQGAVAAQDVDRAKTAYDAAVAQARSAEEAVRQARSLLSTAEANRMQVAIREQDVLASRAAVSQAQAALRNAQTGYSVVAQRRQDVAAARAALAQAKANLQYLEVLAGYTTLTAPTDGIVLTKNVEQGEVVAAGTPVYTLVDPGDMWLRVFIPESQIGRVHVGQRAQVTVDAFPGRAFPGRVVEISSQAEFTPGNVQTKEDRVKLVFGVKIRLDNRDGSLKPGMPADATIFLGAPAEQATR